MIFGIDATNISSGGGLTHLRELLAEADEYLLEDKVVVWGAENTLECLKDKSWLKKHNHRWLNRGPLYRFLWKNIYFTKAIESAECDVLFVPGGNYSGPFFPYVSMSQNMLPFEKSERDRFRWSPTYFRYLILNWLQKRSFNNADGVIFLTNYAKNTIKKVTGINPPCSATIPHGINDEFRYNSSNATSDIREKPFKWLYVSIVNYYKHQDILVTAACELASKGYHLELELVGPGYTKALENLSGLLAKIDPASKTVKYRGSVSYDELPSIYKKADAFIFPSSCENLPNILLEAMASRLPIASSNRGPMPEVLKDAGVYFDPESKGGIKEAMMTVMNNYGEALILADKAYELSGTYSWKRCARETFEFISNVAHKNINEKNSSRSKIA